MSWPFWPETATHLNPNTFQYPTAENCHIKTVSSWAYIACSSVSCSGGSIASSLSNSKSIAFNLKTVHNLYHASQIRKREIQFWYTCPLSRLASSNVYDNSGLYEHHHSYCSSTHQGSPNKYGVCAMSSKNVSKPSVVANLKASS